MPKKSACVKLADGVFGNQKKKNLKYNSFQELKKQNLREQY